MTHPKLQSVSIKRPGGSLAKYQVRLMDRTVGFVEKMRDGQWRAYSNSPSVGRVRLSTGLGDVATKKAAVGLVAEHLASRAGGAEFPDGLTPGQVDALLAARRYPGGVSSLSDGYTYHIRSARHEKPLRTLGLVGSSDSLTERGLGAANSLSLWLYGKTLVTHLAQIDVEMSEAAATRKAAGERAAEVFRGLAGDVHGTDPDLGTRLYHAAASSERSGPQSVSLSADDLLKLGLGR